MASISNLKIIVPKGVPIISLTLSPQQGIFPSEEEGTVSTSCVVLHEAILDGGYRFALEAFGRYPPLGSERKRYPEKKNQGIMRVDLPDPSKFTFGPKSYGTKNLTSKDNPNERKFIDQTGVIHIYTSKYHTVINSATGDVDKLRVTQCPIERVMGRCIKKLRFCKDHQRIYFHYACIHPVKHKNKPVCRYSLIDRNNLCWLNKDTEHITRWAHDCLPDYAWDYILGDIPCWGLEQSDINTSLTIPNLISPCMSSNSTSNSDDSLLELDSVS